MENLVSSASNHIDLLLQNMERQILDICDSGA